MRPGAAIGLLCGAAWALGAQAADVSVARLAENLRAIGTVLTVEAARDANRFAILIDVPEMTRNVPAMQAMGLIDPDMDTATIKAHPTSLMLIHCAQVAVAALRSALFDGRSGRAAITCAYRDDQGAELPAFSLETPLARGGGAAWTPPDAAKLPEIVEKFTLEPAVAGKIAAER